MFDLETYCIVRDLMQDSQEGDAFLEIRPYLQRYALNTTLTLCYGIRMDSVWDDMLREVLEGRLVHYKIRTPTDMRLRSKSVVQYLY